MSELDRLTAVQGLGQSKAEALLEEFGSIEAVTNASQCELTALEGIGKAVAKRVQAIEKDPSRDDETVGTHGSKVSGTTKIDSRNPDPEIQELITSLRQTTSLEKLSTLALRAKDLLRDDTSTAARNPSLIDALVDVYQREEDAFDAEEYDRVYVLRYTAWAISEGAAERPEPVLNTLETPLRLIRDTTISKNVRNSAASILETLSDEHPEKLVTALDSHHGLVRSAVAFQSPEQESHTAAYTAAMVIDTFTAHVDPEPYSQTVEFLVPLIDDDSAYTALARIAEHYPESVLREIEVFPENFDSSSELEISRLTDVLEIAADSATKDIGGLVDDMKLPTESSPTLRRNIISIYASVAENTNQSPIATVEDLDQLVTDEDWQVRKQAVDLVANAAIDQSTKRDMLKTLRSDPIPEVAERAEMATLS